MPIAAVLLQEMQMEMANTRKAIERVPDEKFSFKPHPRSHDLGWLVGHLANLPLWGVMAMRHDTLDLAPPGQEPFKLPELKTQKDVLATFDKNWSDLREAMQGSNSSDERMMVPWTMLKGGHQLLTMPRAAVLRSFVMNHIVHHRGQLTVYLRMTDIPVPALYGPSADEGAGF